LDKSAALSESEEDEDEESKILPSPMDTKAPLFPHLASIFLHLHLLYEDMKLNRVKK